MQIAVADVADRSRAGDGGLLFFSAASLAITLGLQAPAALAHLGVLSADPDRFGPLVGLGLFGPLIAAIAAAWRSGGGASVRDLFAELTRWGAAPAWYVVAFLLPGAVIALGLALADPFEPRPWFYPPRNGATVAAFVLLPFVEEIGWRGFAQPRLVRRYGALRASVVLGALWTLWHAAMFVLQGLTPVQCAVSLPYFVAVSAICVWFYSRPGGGLPLAVLLHAGGHFSNSHQPLPGDAVPFFAQAGGLCALAAVLVLVDPEAWKR